MSQITSIIPAHKWDITIKENNDPLVLIPEEGQIAFRTRGEKHYIRKGILERLIEASNKIPKGYKIIVLDGYRTVAEQKRLWDEKIEKLTKDNPAWSLKETEAKVSKVVARPNPLANHHCGGAIDITICNEKGIQLDMGPRLSGTSPASMYPSFAMFPNTFWKRRITKVQEDNRTILRDVMVPAGFVWYPGEWWHYCWGDRMWAVYTGQKECSYGPVELS